MGTLMGIETEYAVASLDSPASSDITNHLSNELLSALFQAYPCLKAEEKGCFFANGSRVYLDVGCHPEIATAECTSPRELISHVRAGDLMLSRTAADLNTRRKRSISVFRGNIGYAHPSSTWATHESYLTHTNPYDLRHQIVPHLVTRIVFTGAGGFNPFAPGDSISFRISPRTAFLESVISISSTNNRGIFHLKDEPLANRTYRRLHLLCGEALGSETAEFLRLGTTAIVTACAEAGVLELDRISLARPLGSIKLVSADTTCTKGLKLTNGTTRTACQIQRVYLEIAENHLGENWMPEWAEEVTSVWRNVLDSLEKDPMLLANRLDWPMKLALYKQMSQDEGLDWDRLEQWNEAFQVARRQRDTPPPGLLDLYWNTPEEEAERTDMIPPMLCLMQGLNPEDRPLVRRLKARLLEADTRFLQLDGGIFDSLDRSGVLNHRMVEETAAEYAVEHPPASGRGRVRGGIVHKYSGNSDIIVNWDWVANLASNRAVSLNHPFETTARWRKANFHDANRGDNIEGLSRYVSRLITRD